MKIFSALKTFFILLIFSLLSLVISCESRAETVSCFPSQIINVQLNLNLPAYANDLNTKGWIYINEQQSGTRGLILVKTGTGFKVYDRNAPHLCPDTNTTLKVDENSIKIICPKDGAEWILQDGTPIKGSGLPPKSYEYSYNAATGIISIYY